jgi:predicted TIM-barrel fold metal-dependent hydrolase
MKAFTSPIIDFHVHLFPDKGFDAIWHYFAAHGTEVLHRIYSRECIDYLQARGVERIVFSNYAHKKGFAAPMNAWNIDLLEENANLYCFAAFHPDDDDALDYTERMLAHPRVVGVKIHFQVQRLYPHDPRLFPMYEMVMAKKKRLLLHVGNGPTPNEFVGWTHFEPVLARYPDLPANIPHMGCYEYRRFIDLLDAHPNIYLDTAYSFWPDLPFTFDLDPGYLKKYSRRILYGSDFPNIILPRQGEIERLMSFGLPPSVYERIFYANGLKLLEEACPQSVSPA